MVPTRSIRVGILFAVAAAAASTVSCGKTKLTEPNPISNIVSVGGFEAFYNSSQQETRELLIDGRITDIEWNITGDPAIILMNGPNGERGGSYYVSVRSLWTTDQFNRNKGIYFLLQWPDRTEDRLEQPLITSADVVGANGDTLIHCQTDDTLLRESSWHRGTQHEDQAYIEIYSDSVGNFPADVWRWGAETTDACTPVNGSEFVGARDDGDTLGSTTHPSAAFMEDLFDQGAGPVRDAGLWTYYLDNFNPGSNVPLKIAFRGTRDNRLNRGKPVWYVLWETVAKPFEQCDIQNPIRIDDPGVKDKTWNPGDYVPSMRISFPTQSQLDVLARGSWVAGKWGLEVRRDLITRPPQIAGVDQPPRPDDVQLTPGRHYSMRITIVDGRTGARSQSDLLPLYLKPRT
jgi:Ethylbenzene dehydrogenase